MNPPLSLKDVVAFAPPDHVDDYANTRHAGAHEMQTHFTETPPACADNTGAVRFTERRITDLPNNATRSSGVLGFVGVIGGMLISAVLISGVAAGFAMSGVRWSVAGQYSTASVLVVFISAGALLYWWHALAGSARFLTCIDALVERRRHYLHLSSINTFENMHRLGMLARHENEIATGEQPSMRIPRIVNIQQMRSESFDSSMTRNKRNPSPIPDSDILPAA
ncbi:MAG: hypothetical protein GZ085_07580 [Sulfuriferula multivorans]|uniref:Transmembrane protein n=1 Tax=Sulfuriferula multivorans TaxID=1559896 RepID=A0A7C9K1C8_9PROT|nr:hypothetical protein [Sulfuriferula multivorans]